MRINSASRLCAAAAAFAAVLALLTAPVGAQPSEARARIDALMETGKLDEAERAARAGGPAAAVALAEILAYRGRVASADSVLDSVLGSGGSARIVPAPIVRVPTLLRALAPHAPTSVPPAHSPPNSPTAGATVRPRCDSPAA